MSGWHESKCASLNGGTTCDCWFGRKMPEPPFVFRDRFGKVCNKHQTGFDINVDLMTEAIKADEVLQALHGMVAIHDSVTQGQEKELRDTWLPRARALITELEKAK